MQRSPHQTPLNSNAELSVRRLYVLFTAFPEKSHQVLKIVRQGERYRFRLVKMPRWRACALLGHRRLAQQHTSQLRQHRIVSFAGHTKSLIRVVRDRLRDSPEHSSRDQTDDLRNMVFLVEYLLFVRVTARIIVIVFVVATRSFCSKSLLVLPGMHIAVQGSVTQLLVGRTPALKFAGAIKKVLQRYVRGELNLRHSGATLTK
jgi:hypothetical protein